MKLAALNEHAAAARVRVDALEQELAGVYLKALRTAGRKAASRFRGAASLAAASLTAATDPKWVPPDAGALLDQQQLAAQAKKNAAPVQERALRLAVPVGISFDIANPLAQGFLAGLADRSNRILDGFSGEIGAAISEAHEQGLSIPKAAQLIRARVESASQVQASLLARSDLVSIANGGSLLAAQIVAQASADAGEAGPVGKTWVTAGDERVRDTHAEADGQTVPLDQPFDVGGESLMYPGDPDGSPEETFNCRCTQIYGDSLTAAVRAPTPALSSRVTMDETLEVTATPLVLRDFHLTAAAGEPTRWQATLLVEDEPTEDGRMIAAGATSWRQLPLALMCQLATDVGHDGAQVCGRIDQIWRAGNAIQAAGIFDGGEFGQEVARLVQERMLTGISVDLAVNASEVVVTAPEADVEEDQQIADEVRQVTGDEPLPDYDEDLEYLFVVTDGVIGAATICAFQAIANARIEVVTAASGAETWQVATPFEPSLCEVEPKPVIDLAVERLASITASVDAFSERYAALERDLADRFESLTAAQVTLFDSIDERLRKLGKVADDISALRLIAEQKPRRVQLERDADGRLAGLVEER